MIVKCVAFIASLSTIAFSAPVAHVNSGPQNLSGQHNITLENLHITSSSGPCLTISSSTGITVHNSEIGPCGGSAVVINGGDAVKIVDNYIHAEVPGIVAGKNSCCDTGNNIIATGTTNLVVQGNVIAWGETNVLLNKSPGAIVKGNFLLNPQNHGNRGQQIIFYAGSSNGVADGNYLLSSPAASLYRYAENQEDAINDEAGTSGVTIKNNYINGGHSGSGCGIALDSGSDTANVNHNTLIDTGECGIGVADGTFHVIDSNRIVNSTPVAGGGNTAIAVWKIYPNDPPCNNITVSNNIASELKPDMRTESGFWNGGGCDPVKLNGNVFDGAARAQLTPVPSKLPPPLIPPIPFSCAAVSPFSNQTAASCNGVTPASSAAASSVAGPASIPKSSLNTALWTFVNPTGSGSYATNGSALLLTAPGGSNHDPAYGGVNNSVRMMQNIDNADFFIEVKFDSIPGSKYQFQGVIVQQDADNYLRFQFGSTGSILVVGCSKIIRGVESGLSYPLIRLPGSAKSLWMRILKSGDLWGQSWSTDGSAFADINPFTQALSISAIGPFSGNYNADSASVPAFTAVVDSFLNKRSAQAGRPVSDDFNR